MLDLQRRRLRESCQFIFFVFYNFAQENET